MCSRSASPEQALRLHHTTGLTLPTGQRAFALALSHPFAAPAVNYPEGVRRIEDDGLEVVTGALAPTGAPRLVLVVRRGELAGIATPAVPSRRFAERERPTGFSTRTRTTAPAAGVSSGIWRWPGGSGDPGL